MIFCCFSWNAPRSSFLAPQAYILWKSEDCGTPTGPPAVQNGDPNHPKSEMISKVALFFPPAGVFFRDLLFQGLRGTPLTRFGIHFGSILLHFVDLGYRFGRFGIQFCSISASEPLSFFWASEPLSFLSFWTSEPSLLPILRTSDPPFLFSSGLFFLGRRNSRRDNNSC